MKICLLVAALLFQRVGVGDTLPAECTVNDVFQKGGASAGVYNCTAVNTWTLSIPTTGGGDMLGSNNLSDVVSASTSRTNLGLGTLATQSGTFSGTSSGTNTGDQTITLTGDVTGTGTGSFAATIANNAVTNAKAAQMANSTFKCRNTAGTGNSEDCTVAQSKALLGVPTYVLLTANRTNATTSYADITDLIIPVSSNARYDIECRMNYAANATTTGLCVSWTGPASPTLTNGLMVNTLSGGITVGGCNSVGNDTGTATASSALATAGNSLEFRGTWSNGANAGNVQMRFKSEVAVASAIIIQAGSWCKYTVY